MLNANVKIRAFGNQRDAQTSFYKEMKETGRGWKGQTRESFSEYSRDGTSVAPLGEGAQPDLRAALGRQLEHWL